MMSSPEQTITTEEKADEQTAEQVVSDQSPSAQQNVGTKKHKGGMSVDKVHDIKK